MQRKLLYLLLSSCCLTGCTVASADTQPVAMDTLKTNDEIHNVSVFINNIAYAEQIYIDFDNGLYQDIMNGGIPYEISDAGDVRQAIENSPIFTWPAYSGNDVRQKAYNWEIMFTVNDGEKRVYRGYSMEASDLPEGFFELLNAIKH